MDKRCYTTHIKKYGILINIITNESKEYLNFSDISYELKCNPSTISRAYKNKYTVLKYYKIIDNEHYLDTF